jgi:hypothetical protein
MKRGIGLTLLLVGLGIITAVRSGAQSSAIPDAMKEFQSTVGTWQPVPQEGKTPKYQEEVRSFPILQGRWVMSQQILRDKDGKIVYHDCAVYGIDPDTHKLFFHAYNTDGSMDRTHLVESGGGRWIFEGTVYGSDRFRDYRYTITRVDEDHSNVLVELKKDGKYEKWSDTHYERKSREAKPEVQ